jgi:hypothetical protein
MNAECPQADITAAQMLIACERRIEPVPGAYVHALQAFGQCGDVADRKVEALRGNGREDMRCLAGER